ncbi:MAG: hypothetical protein WD063_06215 [Pirellulales bacterium]
MDTKRWLSQLRAELVGRRLPSQYVERFVWELSDHVIDFLEDRMSTDAKDLHGVFDRLGAPGAVADSAAREYRQGRFSRRHPIFAFVVLPILALPALWVGYVMAMMATAKILGLESGKVDTSGAIWQWANACLPFVVLGMLLVPVGLAAAFFCTLAIKAGVSWKWTLVACFVLALLGGLVSSQFVLPTEYTQGKLMIGFRLAVYPSASQALQFLLPLSIGGWVVWRQIKGRVGQALRA